MGGVILIAILVTTVLLYYVTILDNDRRKASYEIQSAQINQDKSAEDLVAIREQELVPDPTDPTRSYIDTKIKNNGSLPLIVSYVVLYCADCTTPIESQEKISITLNGQEPATQRLVGPITEDATYQVDFITERGNVVSAGECVADLSAGICTNDATGGDPDFILSATPDSGTLQQGESASFTISVTRLNGFDDDVDLEISTPAELESDPPSCDPITMPDEVCPEATLEVTVPSDTDPGTYTITITGNGGSITHATTLTISVIHIPTAEELLDDDDEIVKPQIQGVFPNPFGATASSSNKVGLWGVNVANPSDAPMTVTRVVITAFTPYGSNPTIFPSNGGAPYCPIDTTQLPSVGGSWSCPARNTLAWSGSYTIPANNSQEFFVKVGKPSSNENFPSYAINFNVFTTFGQYAKAGYSGSMTSSASEIANVYLSPLVGGGMIGKLTGSAGDTIQARATIANFGDTGVINQGTRLIVAIPKAFSNVDVTQIAAGFANTCDNPLLLNDGSTQISCPLSTNLTSGQTRTIEFTMDAPTDLTETKLYPLLVLADGTDGNAAPMGAVGAVSENVVVVSP
jgi:hypothetical protein